MGKLKALLKRLMHKEAPLEVIKEGKTEQEKKREELWKRKNLPLGL